MCDISIFVARKGKKNAKNEQKQLRLKKKIFISSQRLDGFQLDFREKYN